MKTHKSLETSQKHPETYKNNDNEIRHLYFFIMDHFQVIYEIEFNSHTKSYKSHPKLGLPVVAQVGG